MLDKIKHYQKIGLGLVARFKDVRFIGQLVFVAIVLSVSWSGVKAIEANYHLQKQIATLTQQNTVQKLTNDNLRLQRDYYNTSQYLELAARQDFGLAAPGEKVLLVPRSVALAHTVALPQDETLKAPTKKEPFYSRNLHAWLDFFLHRKK